MSFGMIPKKLHYIWIGPYQDNRNFVNEWNQVLPDYTLHKWTNDTSTEYLEETISMFGGLDNIKHVPFPFVTDIIQLLVMRDHGGVYLDHDMKLVRDPTELLSGKNLALTFQYDPANKDQANTWDIGDDLSSFTPEQWRGALYNSDTVNSCFVAATPNHPFINRMLELLVENHFKPKEEQYPMSDWGPAPSAYSAACREFGLDIDDSTTVEKDGMIVFHRSYFHPAHCTERARIGSEAYYKKLDDIIESKGSYTVHMHDNCGSDLYMSKKMILFGDWYSSR